MHPLPDSGVAQRESGTFSISFPVLINFIVSFKSATKMKKQTTIPANQGFSTLEMWLNSENKLFTELFADKDESITNRKMLLDMQLMLSLVVLLTFNFVNPLMTIICALWFGSAALLVKKYDDTDIQKGGTV